MRRGRPRHDDVLTPREWEVLNLLRDGLTNEQIAARLAITADTAKFHVSEILSKLGVENRQQAAAWQGRPRGVSIAGLPAAIARYAGSLSALKLAGITVIVVAAISLAALAAGVLITESGQPSQEPELGANGPTTDEQLDALIDSLLTDDSNALARRFAGVSARGGLYDFTGFYDPLTMSADEWAALLAAATPELHAVVKDPPEGHRPPGPQGVPRLGTPRDFDVVLLTHESDGVTTAWRFSIVNNRVINLIVTPATGSGPGGRPHFGLRGLIPNPVAEQSSFIVLPPEDTWPAPTPYAASGVSEPVPAQVDTPTFAPDGRTGNPSIDSTIGLLLTGTPSEIATQVGNLVARQNQPVDGPPDHGYTFETVRVKPADWVARLTAAPRQLYAVFTDRNVNVTVLLSVDTGSIHSEAWLFGLEGGQNQGRGDRIPVEDPTLGSELQGLVPNVSSHYWRFYVLPPRESLPVPPPSRPMSARTGDPGVDGILALLQSGDGAGLVVAASPLDDVILRGCLDRDRPVSAQEIEAWAQETVGFDYSLHAVIQVPRGYRPQADHLLILVRPALPYDWEFLGIYEARGRIVGISQGCGNLRSHYLPNRVIVPPLAPGQALDPSRRSGIAEVDAVIDGLQNKNRAAISAAIQYSKVPCSNILGIGAPPRCPDGAAPGTPVDALEHGCEGYIYVPPDAADALIKDIGAGSLYAVVERPALTPGGPPIYAATLDQVRGGAYTLVIAAGRIVGVETTCPAPADPIWQVRGTPDFLLPPP